MRKASDHPEPALQAAALRYAAGDLSPGEAAAFEARLAGDQDARDALSEAVRLSAACLGQAPPEPHASFRAAIRERLAGWCPAWLARRAYRGHPASWSALGASVVVACGLVGVSLAERKRPPAPAAALAPAVAPPAPGEPAPAATDPAPAPRDAEPVAVSAALAPASCGGETGPSVAELWAQMSTPDSVEKAHEDEMRWRNRYGTATAGVPGRPPAAGDTREQ
ncbi:unnamed protein product [Gemmataceae bacterium]|nr:unnamed protein product [Gemmataceae bacterium]VTU01183.1 unnamed protein product [Gemmataceae bacterium]